MAVLRIRYRMMLTRLDVPGFRLMKGEHVGGSTLPRHVHDDPTLCYLFRGRFLEDSPGHSFDCRDDTLKLTGAGDPHSNRFIAGESHGVRVDIDRTRFGDMRAIHRLLDDRVFLPNSGARGLMHRVMVEMNTPDEASALAVEGLLLELLSRLARETTVAGRAMPDWLRRAHDMVEGLFATPVTLGGIAREVGVAPSTLARAYRRTFRSTVGERVRALRVESAARALLRTSLSLAEIAQMNGFYDQSHFTNVFRRQFGVSPARFRARSRE